MDRVAFSEFLIPAPAGVSRAMGGDLADTPDDSGVLFDALVEGETGSPCLALAEPMVTTEGALPLVAGEFAPILSSFGHAPGWWGFGQETAAMASPLDAEMAATSLPDSQYETGPRMPPSFAPEQKFETADAQAPAGGTTHQHIAATEAALASSLSMPRAEAIVMPKTVISSEGAVLSLPTGQKGVMSAIAAGAPSETGMAVRPAAVGNGRVVDSSSVLPQAPGFLGAPSVPQSERAEMPVQTKDMPETWPGPAPVVAEARQPPKDPSRLQAQTAREGGAQSLLGVSKPQFENRSEDVPRARSDVTEATKVVAPAQGGPQAQSDTQRAKPDTAALQAGALTVAAAGRHDIEPPAPQGRPGSSSVAADIHLRYLPASAVPVWAAADAAEAELPLSEGPALLTPAAPEDVNGAAGAPMEDKGAPVSEKREPAATFPARQLSESMSGAAPVPPVMAQASSPDIVVPAEAGEDSRIDSRDVRLMNETRAEGQPPQNRARAIEVPELLRVRAPHQMPEVESDPGMLSGREMAADAVGTSPNPVRVAVGPQAVLPQAITQQVAHAAARVADGPVELTLAPEELGRVRLTLHTSEAGITVAIHAERPETLDLMRRNIDLLARDFRDQGYASIAFDFGNDSRRQNDQPMTAFAATRQDTTEPANGESLAPDLRVSGARQSQGGLDLRM
ncbi:flagellar hook-length control protein FliK [Paenirhodobacter sp. CAU 1674]|uniref:flagellar hook-length control protein FliK n=1 Tax=Paenirhodobacter sp. CAU 1674 TaxID=3032596 RepID=UPI0023DABC93|nr:flagellar hook-length control protein FliK [Paenirhodobacter sp. CAU 1674]MDF2141892.1 flagellar hook-length control protein FliK [Paenirhodobacter sp. CAU 1674]